MAPRPAAATVLVGLLVLALAGCASPQGATFASVRAHAEEAVADVVAALPDGAEFTPTGDPTSTACDSGTAGPTGPEGTAFATFHGSAVLPDTADTGAVLTESIFGWNGMGKYFTQTIATNDIHGVVAVAAFGAVMTAIGAVLSDIAVVILDPRVRVS